MDTALINIANHKHDWRKNYRYGLYAHKLIASNGEVYTRHFIVIKNRFNLIVHFTNLHNYVGTYEKKVFAPLTSDAETKLRYVCIMLNYVLIEHYSTIGIDHVFNISRDVLKRFFRSYAQEPMAYGGYRGQQSIEKCVYSVTMFFRRLRQKYGEYVLLSESDLFYEATVYGKCGRVKKKKLPALQVKGFIKRKEIFRELPTKTFQILLNLAFRYVRAVLLESEVLHPHCAS